MKIEQFDKPILRLLSAEIEQALAPIATKYGISLTYKGASYSATNATLKIEAATIGTSGDQSKEREDFKLYAGMYGLKATDLDAKIIYAGKPYQITGMNPRRTKYPIMARRFDGVSMCLTASGVKSALDRQRITTPVATTATPATPPQPSADETVEVP